MQPWKFYIRSNNNKVYSIETRRIVAAHLLLLSDFEKRRHTTLFELMMVKLHRHYLIFKYRFICALFFTTYKLTNYRKMI